MDRKNWSRLADGPSGSASRYKRFLTLSNPVIDLRSEFAPLPMVKPPAGRDLSMYDFIDEFDGASDPLNNRAALKGGIFGTTGTGAETMRVSGDGYAEQSDAALVSYAFNRVAFPRVQKHISASWMFRSAVDHPIAIAMMTNNTFSGTKALHGALNLSNVDFTLLDTSTNVFLAPAWFKRGADWTLESGELYAVDLYYEDKFCKMTLSDHAGALVGQQTSYDPNMVAYAGLFAFFENYLSSSMRTRRFFTKPTLPVGWTWPSLNILAPKGDGWSDISGFAVGPFTGTVTPGSGKVTISGATYGMGGAVDIGNLAANDIVYFSIDASNWAGLHASVVLTQGEGNPIASNSVTVSGNGRWQGALTCNTAGATKLLIGATAAPEDNSFSVDVSSRFLMLKNPPLTP